MKLIFGVLCLGLHSLSWASVTDKTSIELLKKPNGKRDIIKEDAATLDRLERMFATDSRSPGLATMLKRHTFLHRQKAVPLLITVMKESRFPDQNRWQATMLLAQVMGKKSAPFIAKFADHPNWMMRLASLKALLGLRESSYKAVYSKALQDPSLIVRVQALDNISQLKVTSLAPEVWGMMYDQSNYTGSAGQRKRTSIVKHIIRTLGDLKYQKAQLPLAKLIQKPKYVDLIDDLDYSLEKITGEKSPDTTELRRKHWSKLVVSKAPGGKL